MEVVPAVADSDLDLLPTTLCWEGCDYTRNSRYQSKNKSTVVGYYTCKYRRSQGCHAELIGKLVIEDMRGRRDGEPLPLKLNFKVDTHTCGSIVDAGSFNVESEMLGLAETKGLGNRKRPVGEIASEVSDEIRVKYTGMNCFSNFHCRMVFNQNLSFIWFTDRAIHMATTNQLTQRIYSVRNANKQEWETVILRPELSKIGLHDQKHFLKFHHNFENTDGEMEHIVCWGHPSLTFLFEGEAVNVFIDGTFDCVPPEFYQLLIIMTYSKGHATYVPVFYILLQSKTENVYYLAIHLCIICNDWEINAKSITCDFELALQNAIQTLFLDDTECELVCCVFHFLQANRRKLASLHLPVARISQLLHHLRVLTIIDENEVLTKGVAYVRSKIDEAEYKAIYDAYWYGYFPNTWITTFEVGKWNVFRHLGRKDDVLVNLTNNPLERFNGILGAKFGGTHHPSMEEFVTVIRDVSIEYAERLDSIRAKKTKKPAPATANIPVLPDDYAAFQIPGFENEDD
jgi:hypothetical protein